MSSVSPVNGLNAQPALPVIDPQAFSAVRAAIESAFSSARVEPFLSSLGRAKLRIRNFESVIGKGLLGTPTLAEYQRLSNNDQGQIREFCSQVRP